MGTEKHLLCSEQINTLYQIQEKQQTINSHQSVEAVFILTHLSIFIGNPILHKAGLKQS